MLLAGVSCDICHWRVQLPTSMFSFSSSASSQVYSEIALSQWLAVEQAELEMSNCLVGTRDSLMGVMYCSVFDS